MQDILSNVLGTHRSYAFLSGPSFAREIMEEQTTAVVIASEVRARARLQQKGKRSEATTAMR